MVTINPRVLPGLKDADDIVAEIWEIDRSRLYIKTRKREVVEARMTVMVYRYKVMGFTMEKSAEPYHLDHATVDHAVKTITDLLQTNASFREKYELFHQRIKHIKSHEKNQLPQPGSYHDALRPDRGTELRDTGTAGLLG